MQIDTIFRIESELNVKLTPEEIVSEKNMGEFIQMKEDKL